MPAPCASNTNRNHDNHNFRLQAEDDAISLACGADAVKSLEFAEERLTLTFRILCKSLDPMNNACTGAEIGDFSELVEGGLG